MAAPVLSQLAEGIEGIVEDVILGNVAGPGGNLGRLSALEAGLPLSVPGLMVDRQCSAGLEAIRLACYLIQGGAGACYIAGGVESSSTSPFLKRARFSPDRIGDPDMLEAAENVAQKYNISKERQDHYTLLSHKRSWETFENGYFTEEIVAIDQWMKDEAFFKKRNMQTLLSRSKPFTVNDHGTVTAANSCGINDGAAAVVVMEENTALSLGFKPVLRFVDSQVAGIHPCYPGAAPIPAIRNLLEKNQLSVEKIDLFEINEAFACKIIACAQELNIPYERLNIRGGALTLGHPYGASGTILVTRLFHEVQKHEKVKYVIAAIGSGGGIGVAVLFEKVH